MFGKLLKHEFNSQRGLLGWLTVAALAAGGIGAVVAQLLIHIFRDEMYAAETVIHESRETLLSVAAIVLILVVMFLLFAIMAYATATHLILCYRFYKHHFTDEGYLTFTLPATTHQILLASIVNILIWTIISVVTVLVSLAVFATPLLILAQQQAAVIMPEMGEMFAETFGEYFGVMYAVSLICGGLGQTILPLTAITIGAQVAKKHKLLAGIGIYVGLNAIVSFISSIVSAVASVTSMFAMEIETVMTVTYLVPSVLYLGIAVGGYFLMHHLVANKLNLT